MPEIVFARAHAVSARGPQRYTRPSPCWHGYCISKNYANFYCLCTQTLCSQLRVACSLARLPISCSLNQKLRLHDSVSKIWIVYYEDMLLRDSPGLPIPARSKKQQSRYTSYSPGSCTTSELCTTALYSQVSNVSRSRGAAGRREAVKYLSLCIAGYPM